jgi:hypothetical protein
LFPVIGSANPSLTATTLARRTADAIVASRTIAPDPAFRLLFTGSRQPWQMAGGGDFLTLFGTILEARPGAPGLGLLWYTREVFRNFVLQVDWLLVQPDNQRPGGRADTGHLDPLPGVECEQPRRRLAIGVGPRLRDQIDDMGFNPRLGRTTIPCTRPAQSRPRARNSTLAPQSLPANGTFRNQARSASIKVTLNGQL